VCVCVRVRWQLSASFSRLSSKTFKLSIKIFFVFLPFNLSLFNSFSHTLFIFLSLPLSFSQTLTHSISHNHTPTHTIPLSLSLLLSLLPSLLPSLILSNTISHFLTHTHTHILTYTNTHTHPHTHILTHTNTHFLKNRIAKDFRGRFHQLFSRAFFVRLIQNVTRKKTFVQKTRAKNVGEIDSWSLSFKAIVALLRNKSSIFRLELFCLNALKNF